MWPASVRSFGQSKWFQNLWPRDKRSIHVRRCQNHVIPVELAEQSIPPTPTAIIKLDVLLICSNRKIELKLNDSSDRVEHYIFFADIWFNLIRVSNYTEIGMGSCTVLRRETHKTWAKSFYCMMQPGNCCNFCLSTLGSERGHTVGNHRSQIIPLPFCHRCIKLRYY